MCAATELLLLLCHTGAQPAAAGVRGDGGRKPPRGISAAERLEEEEDTTTAVCSSKLSLDAGASGTARHWPCTK